MELKEIQDPTGFKGLLTSMGGKKGSVPSHSHWAGNAI